jgi:gamma-glutamylputrescine oxidase
VLTSGSLYATTADPNLAFPPLVGRTQAHVAIIGGGYTGLSAALHLAEAGIDVALVEAKRIGWGASGRNGGQLHSGQRRDQDWLEARFGVDDAHHLWAFAEEAKGLVKELIARHRIECEWRAGLIETTHKRRLVGHERVYVEKLKRDYGYAAVEWIGRDDLAAAIGTNAYFGGRRDAEAGHLHPLKFAQGLARAAQKAGARIHEATAATAVTGSAGSGFQIACGARGELAAEIVIIAGDGYLEGIDTDIEARLMTIDNYILVTEPVGAGEPGGIIPGGEAVSDTRFVVYYFRPSLDGRLLFGGGETYSRRAPADIAGFVRRHLVKLYPQFAGARIDYAWGGAVAITLSRVPLIRRIRPGVYVAGGYSGQGVALAPFAGKVIADAIRGDPGRLDRFAALPVPPFPGGKRLRRAALAAGMLWYSLRDRI